MKLSDYTHEFTRFALYATIGLGGATIDYLLYALQVHLGVHYIIANALSTCAGILFSFFVNLRYNFRSTDHVGYRFISFFTVGIAGLVLSTALLRAFVNTFDMDPLIAKLATLAFVLLFQFSLNRTITFGRITVAANWVKENRYLVLAMGVLAAAYIIPLLTHQVVDEYDNFLGGKHIIEFGSWPYHGFFSHHMIMPYLFSAIFYIFAGDNTYLLRIAFYLVSAAFILWNALLIQKYAGKLSGVAFVLLFAISITFLGMGRFLSENLATLFVVSSINLLMYIVIAKKRLSYWHIGTISLLLTLVTLTTLNYIYVIAVIGLFTLYLLFRNYWVSKDLKRGFLSLVLLGWAPLIALGLLVATRTLRPLIKDAVLFNTEHYAQYAPALGSGPVDTFFGALSANLAFLGDVVREPFGQVGAFSLLLFTTLILAIVALRKHCALVAMIVATILLANTRNDEDINAPTSYFFVLMRIVVLLLVAYLLPSIVRTLANKKTATTNQLLYFALAILSVWTIAAYSISSISVMFKAASQYSQATSSPGRIASIRDAERYNRTVAGAMQAIIDKDPSHAGYFVGPLNFGPQMQMATKQTTNYTFWMPWIADCSQCTKQFITQINANKPSAILWERNYVIMDANTDDHTPQFMAFLKDNYYAQKTYPGIHGNSVMFVRKDLKGVVGE